MVTTGAIDTSKISIININDPVFTWNAYGITAFDAEWNSNMINTIGQANKNKFVRFDKHGIYGINDSGTDGTTWYPKTIEELDAKSTFALTWEGLKVKNHNGITLKIGDGAKNGGGNTDLLSVIDANGKRLVGITENGSFIYGENDDDDDSEEVYRVEITPTTLIFPTDAAGSKDSYKDGTKTVAVSVFKNNERISYDHLGTDNTWRWWNG
jgi:hypothetical protein